MFKLMAVDDWGHLYYENGLLEPYKNGLQPILQDFEHLSQAEKYATTLIKQYPYMCCLIYQQDVLVSTIKDEDYWHWYQEKQLKIRELNRKKNTLLNTFEAIVFIVMSQLLLILFHLTVHINLVMQMLSAAFASFILWSLVKLYAGSDKIR